MLLSTEMPHTMQQRPLISLHSFARHKRQSYIPPRCVAQSSGSNFERRWAARQQDWRTRLTLTLHRARESAAAQQALVVLKPLINVYRAIAAFLAREEERFFAFAEQETLRAWQWENKTEQQREWWVNVRKAFNMCLTTAVYMFFCPMSVFWSFYIPLQLSYLAYEEHLWWRSPIVLVCLAFLPFKLGGPHFRWF